MRTFQSVVEPRGEVTFPPFTGERVYMREIRKEKPLPADLLRWQETVDAMLAGVDASGPIYLMVDQSVVKAGTSQRRPGLHIDGYWQAESASHGGGRHAASIGGWDTGGGWIHAAFEDEEALILASDIAASRAMLGTFSGQPGEGGDCSHVDLSGAREIRLAANRVYAGNVTMLHESLPVSFDTPRTLVRLSVPGWSPSLDTMH